MIEVNILLLIIGIVLIFYGLKSKENEKSILNENSEITGDMIHFEMDNVILKNEPEVGPRIEVNIIDITTKLIELKPGIIPTIPCSVCKLNFKSEKDILACPHCLIPSHKVHIQEWVKVKSFCPHCKNKL